MRLARRNRDVAPTTEVSLAWDLGLGKNRRKRNWSTLLSYLLNPSPSPCPRELHLAEAQKAVEGQKDFAFCLTMRNGSNSTEIIVLGLPFSLQGVYDIMHGENIDMFVVVHSVQAKFAAISPSHQEQVPSAMNLSNFQ